jgi:hypothetical protein
MRSLDAGQYGSGPNASLDQNRQSNRRKHKEDSSPGGHFSEQVGCSTRTERRLGPLTAESTREICALTLLEKNNPNQDKADNNVNRTHKPDHENLNRWCGRGDLNPHASRRHPLKMVCLPISPLPRCALPYFQQVAENTAEGLSTVYPFLSALFALRAKSVRTAFV